MRILAIDPSGNFNEGKGTTGWALFDENIKLYSCGQIMAEQFDVKEKYWEHHVNLINQFNPDAIVIEDYLLYASQSKVQINSRFETPKLIGIIELHCFNNNIPLHFQSARDVKLRWTDERLISKGLISKTGSRYFATGVLITTHIRDAIRHGVHFITFKLKKEQKK